MSYIVDWNLNKSKIMTFCYTMLYNLKHGKHLQFYLGREKKKKKKKKERRASFSKEKGCYVLVMQEFISLTCQLIYISLILETKKVECPSNP